MAKINLNKNFLISFLQYVSYKFEFIIYDASSVRIYSLRFGHYLEEKNVCTLLLWLTSIGMCILEFRVFTVFDH